MNLEGRKIIVNKSTSELVKMLKNPEDYRGLMPDTLQNFEARDNGFKFGLKGMPEIALVLGEITEEKAILNSASSSLEFELVTHFTKLSSDKTEAQMLFEGKFNPFIKMMVEKPLQNFMNALTDKIESHFA